MELLRLTDRHFTYPRGAKERVAVFRCGICQNEVELPVGEGKHVFSCGCVHGNYRHGLSKHPLFQKWAAMKSRCSNPNDPRYRYYGARGIGVCPEWANDFVEFFAWSLASGWEPGLQLDRVDNDAGYSPENCRFVTPQANCRNRRTAKVSQAKFSTIRADLAAGLSSKEIRSRHGVSSNQLHKIKTAKTKT